MEVAFTAFIVLSSITCIWLLYVARNAYFIVLPGLRQPFFIWLTHLIYMILVLVFGIIRPSWDAEMSKLAYNSSFLCHFLGRLFSSVTAFSSYFVTTYGFSKVKLYMMLARDKTLCLTSLYTSLSIGVVLNGLVVLICFVTVNSGPTMENGYRFCTTFRPVWQIAKYMEVIFYIFLNVFTIGIFYKFRKLRDDSVPGLHSMMIINLYVVPFLFGTTIFIHLSNIVFFPVAERGGFPDSAVTFYLLSNLFDNLLNSMGMYWNIFGTINMDFLDEDFDDMDISAELRELEAGGGNTLASESNDTRIPRAGYVWICLPGAHPLKVKSSIVIQNGLESHVIFKEKRLRQIKKYRERGFVRSLFSCCNNTEELMDELDKMKVHENHIFVE